MLTTTPYFPQLRAQCAPLGASSPRAAAPAAALDGLAALFGRFFPGLMVPAKKGPGSRQRDLPRAVVFWAFLGQVLEPGSSCRAALARLQAAALVTGRRVPQSTSAYCQARRALPLPWLESLFAALGRWFEPRTGPLWLGRVVRLIDGTGFSMPDSAPNRGRWPHGPLQVKAGGFPTGKLVALFCLHSGRLIGFLHGSWQHHDLFFARRLVKLLRPGEVLVGDRAYCGWVFFSLLRRQKVDFVVRLPRPGLRRRRRQTSWWESWPRPQRRPEYPPELLARLPKELLVRLVRGQICRRGYRPEPIFLVTSLLDAAAVPDRAVLELYARRWQVELHFRQIKTNLQLDILRGLTPAMIERELWMHALAYNLLRALLLEAALTHALPIERLSFQGSRQALIAWAAHCRPRRTASASRSLLLRIASDLVPLRPGRHEPRARKRRQKYFPPLRRPRHLLRSLSNLARCLS